MKNVKAFVIIFAISLTLTACFRTEDYYEPLETATEITDDTYDDNAPAAFARSVKIISAGEKYTALEHANHGFSTMIRDNGSDEVEMISASGWFKLAEDVVDELNPFPFEDDFQIIIEGQLFGEPYYYFYKLTDGEWIKALAVYVRDGTEQIFLTHGGSLQWGDWEELYAESFLDLLEPGEYILDVGAWWGDSEAAVSFQSFFRFIK